MSLIILEITLLEVSYYIFFYCLWKQFDITAFFFYFKDRYILYPEVLGQGANSLVTVAEEKSTQKIYAAKVKQITKYHKFII